MNDTLRSRIETLKQKTAEARKLNEKDVNTEMKRQKARTHPNEEAITRESPHKSLLDYSLREWEEYDTKSTAGGYKNFDDLAYATYKKGISTIEPDKEQYLRNKDSSDLFLVVDDASNVSKVVNSLRDASERKLKRKRTGDDASAYITEKNKQFNMKLEREYGRVSGGAV